MACTFAFVCILRQRTWWMWLLLLWFLLGTYVNWGGISLAFGIITFVRLCEQIKRIAGKRFQLRRGGGALFCFFDPRLYVWFHPCGFLSKPRWLLEPRPSLDISSWSSASSSPLRKTVTAKRQFRADAHLRGVLLSHLMDLSHAGGKPEQACAAAS